MVFIHHTSITAADDKLSKGKSGSPKFDASSVMSAWQQDSNCDNVVLLTFGAKFTKSNSCSY